MTKSKASYQAMSNEELVRYFQQFIDTVREEANIIFEVLYERCEPTMLFYYRSYPDLNLERADFCQEGAIVLFCSASVYEGKRASFHTYFSQSLEKRCLDLYRESIAEKRSTTSRIVYLEDLVEERGGWDDYLPSAALSTSTKSFVALKNHLGDFYQSLSPVEKKVFQGMCQPEATFSEVARQLGISEMTARQAYHRAKKKFKRALKKGDFLLE